MQILIDDCLNCSSQVTVGDQSPWKHEGWKGWDDYADFYDWENAQTLDRRDVKFWQAMAERANGPILELGCGTGRVTIPVARTGARIVGVDRSSEMLGHARKRSQTRAIARATDVAARRHPLPSIPRVRPVRSRHGAVRNSAVARPRIRSEGDAGVGRARARARRLFGVDLVPDLPVWKEYRDKVRFRGVRRGGKSRITLVESVRQDRAKKLTIFDQEYIEQRGRERTHAPIFARLPHAHGAADDQTPRKCRVSD